MGGGIWEVTLQILDGTSLEYKYTRGTWETVEWWGSIVSIANRHVTISYGLTGTQLVDDTATDYGSGSDDHKAVQYWRDPLVVSATGGASGAVVTFERNIQPEQHRLRDIEVDRRHARGDGRSPDPRPRRPTAS